MSNLRRAMRDLINSGHADKEPSQLSFPDFNIEDVYDEHSNLFPRRVKKDLSKIKAYNILHQINKPVPGFKNWFKDFLAYTLNIGCAEGGEYIRTYYQVRFVGVRVAVENLDKQEEAVKKIANELDFLSKKGYLKGHMLKLSRLALHSSTGGYIFMSYVLVDQDGSNHIDNKLMNKHNGLYVHEGGCPAELGDL